MKEIESIYEIIHESDGFLFDAYGVLVHEDGVLAGARELDYLKSEGIPY